MENVTLYSILEDPMTSCGCFECICGIEPMSNGVVITNRSLLIWGICRNIPFALLGISPFRWQL